jgi:cobyrinic acid a,c-diamide synthase
VATGVMAALRARGTRVAAAKVGPDYIDPGYHALATGRAGRNLDSWICGEDAVAPLAARAASGADLLVVEGVMGLFDGASGDGPEASTASIARLLDAPVVLVVDASAMSRSVAALVHGFSSFEPDVRVAGVVLNRVGGPGHLDLLREALGPLGVPVLGALPRDDAWSWRDRHLGLVPVAEQPSAIAGSLAQLGAATARSVDLDALVTLARGAPERVVPEPPLPERAGRARVAVAAGPAFGFVYPDNLEALAAAGGELLTFDPLADPALPDGTEALYLGGGFPEVFAGQLAANAPLLADVRARVANGLVTWAECGGLLFLARSLGGAPLVAAVPADAEMTGTLTLGYRRATLQRQTPLGPAGSVLRGHEFHYSTLEPSGDALVLEGRRGRSLGGFATSSLLATYLHLHLGGDPGPAARFVASATPRSAQVLPGREGPPVRVR